MNNVLLSSVNLSPEFLVHTIVLPGLDDTWQVRVTLSPTFAYWSALKHTMRGRSTKQTSRSFVSFIKMLTIITTTSILISESFVENIDKIIK